MKIRELNLTLLKDEFQAPYTAFIGSASFEERCLSVAKSLNANFATTVVIFHSGSDAPWTQTRLEQFERIASGGTDNFHSVQISMIDPVYTADSIIDALYKIDYAGKKKVRILFDITTFTHEALLIVFKIFLLRLQPLIKAEDASLTFDVIYTPADGYSIGATRSSEVWLSRGVRQVRSVLGYPGEMDPSRKVCLILLSGFEPERAMRVIDTYKPDIMYVGKASETQSVNTGSYAVHKELSEEIAAYYGKVKTFSFSGINHGRTKDAILRLAQAHEDMNVVVAPMNTKISTIGCALAAIEQSRIQLCYAVAELYNYANYSTPSDRCIVFRMSSATMTKLQQLSS
jgi:hypothetical protein